MCIKLEQVVSLFHQLGLKDLLQDMNMDKGQLALLMTLLLLTPLLMPLPPLLPLLLRAL